MAIFDYLVEFGASTNVDTAIGSAQFGDSIDLTGGGAIAQTESRIGADASHQMYVVITVTTAFTSAGSATVQFSLVTDAQDPVVPATATVHVLSAEIPIADLQIGDRLALTVPIKLGERYLGLVTTVGTAALTAGAVTAGLTIDPVMDPLGYSYPDAVN